MKLTNGFVCGIGSFFVVAIGAYAQERVGLSTAPVAAIHRALDTDFGLELWTVVSVTETDVWVSTKPTYLAPGLCRSFVLRGAQTKDRLIFDDSALMQQAKHFYYAPSTSDGRLGGSATTCGDVPLDRYFAVPLPIEVGTLAELAVFLTDPSTAASVRRECECESMELSEIRVQSFGSLIDIRYDVSYRTSKYPVSARVRRSEGAYIFEDLAKVHD